MTNISRDLLSQLNPEQAKAVSIIEGPVLVFAGAGTGKTRVITYRIANMIRNGILPEKIVGMTFTNKAAGEMRERLDQLVKFEDSKKVFLGTFHSFCARMLRKEIRALGFGNNFTIADDSDQFAIVKQAITESGFQKEEISGETCIAVISRAKGKMRTPQDLNKVAENEIEIKAAHVYERYMQILQNQNMVDFDDLLFFTVRIWEENPDILKNYQEKYEYLLIDEYQDTNYLQFQLVKLLAGKKKNVCVVGDDDQSIYAWRGADIKNILDFPSHFPKSQEIKLEQNYRCTNNILKAANAIISKTSERCEKVLWSKCGKGENLKIITADTDEGEAKFIADAVYDVIASNPGASFGDIAVLYRSNYQSRLFENSLRDQKVPYRLIGARSFYERREIRDSVAYLKLITNPKDDQSFLRIIGVPPRGIGDKAIEQLKKLQHACFLPFSDLAGQEEFLSTIGGKGASASKELHATLHKWRNRFKEPGAIAQKAEDYFKELGFFEGLLKLYRDRNEAEKRQENVYELLNAISSYERNQDEPPTLQDFLESYALYDDSNKVDEEKEDGKPGNTVTLMTVHSAKGLEFPFVFLPGLEHNIFPHERALAEGNGDEERRLFYVALTRAKKNVYIIHTRQRMYRGRVTIQRPSPFLFELPEDITERVDSGTAFKKLDVEDEKKAWMALYAIGNE